MTTTNLESTAQALVAGGKGILAADETPGTLTRRLDVLSIVSTPESRRDYREMFFTTRGIAEFISGVIMQDETIRQRSTQGTLLADVLAQQGILPGIKVDNGAKPLAGAPGENITEGLDGLRDRLKEYRAMGARFAKWRAVIAVSDRLPSVRCVKANAHALSRYAALCQEQAIVPIVEPEVLMDGSHSIERCEEVTANVLHAVFNALFDQNVALEGMLLKPNMVISGIKCERAGVRQRSRASHSALSQPARSGRGPRHCFLIRRPESPHCDRASERDQSARSAKALAAQLFLWTGLAGGSAQGVAGKERKPQRRPASFLSPRQVPQRGGPGQVYQCRGT